MTLLFYPKVVEFPPGSLPITSPSPTSVMKRIQSKSSFDWDFSCSDEEHYPTVKASPNRYFLQNNNGIKLFLKEHDKIPVDGKVGAWDLHCHVADLPTSNSLELKSSRIINISFFHLHLKLLGYCRGPSINYVVSKTTIFDTLPAHSFHLFH